MSKEVKAMLKTVREFVPALTSDLHKGSNGRIGVVGGCSLYTGAPYFAARSAMLLGADLSFVFCSPDAALPIKCYSPDLIVYPSLHDKKGDVEITSSFSRLHSLVVGPGLGRGRELDVARKVIQAAVSDNLPLVIDGDAINIVVADPAIVKGHRLCVLTPNVNEYSRLNTTDKPLEDFVASLAGPVVVQKGATDVIVGSTGRRLVCDVSGSLRRCGGQGDVLAGTMATFLAWGCRFGKSDVVEEAAWAACYVTRKASEAAFSQRGRSMTSADVTEAVATVVNKTKEMFG